MEKKETLILGATTNPERYAYKAANRLVQTGHPIKNIGIKSGEVAGEIINKPGVPLQNIHTITVYIGPEKQKEYYDYIINTRPKRIIFNPGTENEELGRIAQDAGIETIDACTLVLLSTGEY